MDILQSISSNKIFKMEYLQNEFILSNYQRKHHLHPRHLRAHLAQRQICRDQSLAEKRYWGSGTGDHPAILADRNRGLSCPFDHQALSDSSGVGAHNLFFHINFGHALFKSNCGWHVFSVMPGCIVYRDIAAILVNRFFSN
jgi:hypothetical protein